MNSHQLFGSNNFNSISNSQSKQTKKEYICEVCYLGNSEEVIYCFYLIT